MRLGLLGGTFDPPHFGHLDVADAARTALDLDDVWLVPARQPPHRTPPIASPSHRFAMVALAASTRPGLKVSDMEMETAGPSYSVDTVGRLLHRGPVPSGSLFFIVGADAFAEIRTWRHWAQLLDLCHFAVVSRPGCPAPDLRGTLPELAGRMHDAPGVVGDTPGIFLIDAKTADVSSTRLRQVLQPGGTADGLVPGLVAAHAMRHGLYATPTPQERSRG